MTSARLAICLALLIVSPPIRSAEITELDATAAGLAFAESYAGKFAEHRSQPIKTSIPFTAVGAHCTDGDCFVATLLAMTNCCAPRNDPRLARPSAG